MKQGELEKCFARSISQILEVAEGMFGTSNSSRVQWEFYRSVLLKRLNELKREVREEILKSQGAGNGSNFDQTDR